MIENFKVGGAERLGVGYEQVRERNPRVVYCSITGFGSEREPRGRPGYDFVAQAEIGPDVDHRARRTARPTRWAWRWWTCSPACTPPPRCSPRCTGERAARIEVPLLDSGLAGLVNVAQNALVTGTEPERHGNAHPNIVPYQDFETSSGRIAVAAANDGLFRALCSVMGLDSLPEDARFATNAGRVEHRRELIPLLEARFRERPRGGLAGRARGRRRALGQGALGARRARRGGGRRPPGNGEGRAPDGGPARPGGLADLGRNPRRAQPRRRCWASTRRRCWPSSAACPEEIEQLAARGVVGLG